MFLNNIKLFSLLINFHHFLYLKVSRLSNLFFLKKFLYDGIEFVTLHTFLTVDFIFYFSNSFKVFNYTFVILVLKIYLLLRPYLHFFCWLRLRNINPKNYLTKFDVHFLAVNAIALRLSTITSW